ncbi:MAG TPA: OmpA family protein [Gemmatimonadales bacterium]|jgi:outer membrane protein OmpA-like peptidoglycan-associated protein
MRTPLRLATLALLAGAIAVIASPFPAHAQFGKRLKDALKQKAEQTAIQKATDAEGQAIDGALSGGGNGSAQATPVETGAVTPAATTDEAPAEKKLWVNYDFIPGERTLFFTDYSEDAVGNFPERLEFREGNMEVAELGGQRYIRAPGHGAFTIPLPEALPQRFTIEIDVINRVAFDGWAFQLQGGADQKFSLIRWGTDGAGLVGGGGGQVQLTSNDANRTRYRGKPATLRVLGDGKYIKVYLDERRLVNVPNAGFERGNALSLIAEGRSDDNPVYIGKIRVAESRKSIYDDLASKGRVATQGILFATGSDQVRPESGPTLKEIATMLQQHPELKLRIEGHTDNVGAKDANLTLSERRALAVKNALVSDFGIDGARLDSKGFGDGKPAGSNATPEGRQNNRRVELVRL